jgi:predicted ATPase
MLTGLSGRKAPESLVGAIFEESQGNPFFVEEMYRHLVEEGKVFDAAGEFRTDVTIDESDVPENVRLIIGRRLERLDENEKRVLAAAAVIGRSFSFQLLTASAGSTLTNFSRHREGAADGNNRPQLRGAGAAVYLRS